MKTLFALIAATLTACGGGGDAGPTAAASACTPLAVVRVQLFGDSTMAGLDGATGAIATQTPAQVLQSLMDAKFGTGAVAVTSRAVSGTNLDQLQAGTDGLNRPWPQSVAADILVINHGINNMVAGTDPAEYAARLRAMAGAVTSAVIFETPNLTLRTNVAPFADAVRTVAAGLPLADAYAYTATRPGLLGDWAHPTAAGYREIVTNVLSPAVAPLVASLRCE